MCDEPPSDAFQEYLRKINAERPRPSIGISPAAHVAASAKIGDNTNVFPGAFIGDEVIVGDEGDIGPGSIISSRCRVGNRLTLYPNVVIYHDVVIGSRVVIHAGAVLGSDGFAFRFDEDCWNKVPSQGTLEIHDDVEIGAGSTIARGLLGTTVIGRGTKLDNLVSVGKNCHLGQKNILCAHVALSADVVTGDYVRCANRAHICDHVRLGDRVIVGVAAIVSKDVPSDETYL